MRGGKMKARSDHIRIGEVGAVMGNGRDDGGAFMRAPIGLDFNIDKGCRTP